LKREPPFNPLDKTNLGVSVADALLLKPVDQLPPAHEFIGAGIYVIYYSGDYPPYESIASRNRDDRYKAPIYVGKAIPLGARRGNVGLGIDPGSVLHRRLREHSRSIQQASNLSLEDFRCRYLIVDDIWIPLGESLLINRFRPVWNQLIDGFGNHDPGAGRRNQQRSPWDVLHPGRSWVELQAPSQRTEEEILLTLAASLSPRETDIE
jgi:hypothetical protein